MKVIIVPGSRNESLISQILNSKKTMTLDNWINYTLEGCEDAAFMDALYYTSEAREEKLLEQAQYFQDLLEHDELPYYAARMGGFESEN